MSQLNIRQFAKQEQADTEGPSGATIANPSNDSHNDRIPNESDDSDEGIQYLAPDETAIGKHC